MSEVRLKGESDLRCPKGRTCEGAREVRPETGGGLVVPAGDALTLSSEARLAGSEAQGAIRAGAKVHAKALVANGDRAVVTTAGAFNGTREDGTVQLAIGFEREPAKALDALLEALASGDAGRVRTSAAAAAEHGASMNDPLHGGVKRQKGKDQPLHANVVVPDGREGVVGSVDFQRRPLGRADASRQSLELGVAVRDSEAAATILGTVTSVPGAKKV